MLVGGGGALVGIAVAALVLIAPSASATSVSLKVSPQVEQALVAAFQTSLHSQGAPASSVSVKLVGPARESRSPEAPKAAFDATNRTYYASACAQFRAPLPELLRLHSTYPYSPVTLSPRSISVSCQLFAKGTTGTWHVIQDTPSLGCGAVGVTLRALWDGVPACNAPVYDL